MAIYDFESEQEFCSPNGTTDFRSDVDQELSKFTGIPCDVVTAQLRHWEKAGIINKHLGYLTLKKPEELTRLT